MNVRLREFAARQEDIVAVWQLREAGATPDWIRHWVSGARLIHSGVYALNHAPLTQRQLWFAASLTTPDSFLSHGSAAACYGFRPFKASFEVVTRPGSGGRKRSGNLLVCRSTALAGATTRHTGIAITTAERTLIDMSAHLREKATRKAFREALRLKTTTIRKLQRALDRNGQRRGTHLLKDLATRYAHLPYARSKSDAESRALEVFADLGGPQPLLNTEVAGKEADLTFHDRKVIIEIDGPQFHRYKEEDARKQAIWERAGYTVRRIPSDLVFEQPATLIALAAPVTPAHPASS